MDESSSEREGCHPEEESDERLRNRLTRQIADNLDHYFVALPRTWQGCLEGTVTGKETGTVTRGIVRALRLRGRETALFFIELDAATDKPVATARIALDDDGTLGSAATTLELAKVAAVSSPENSNPISLEEHSRLRQGVDPNAPI